MTEYGLSDEDVAGFFEAVLPHLDERQRRFVAGGFAEMLGHGGIAAVAMASGLGRNTIGRGASAIRSGAEVTDRARASGGGRKAAEVAQPGLASALDSLVEPETRGDPMCALRWTTKSTRHLSDQLNEMGFTTSHTSVRWMLLEAGYSLQGTAKTIEGTQHPDRDAQFRYIAELVKAFQADGEPVISVDAKKKEQVGQYANPGQEWHPKGRPIHVKDHDFPDPAVPKAVPYGVYDLAGNEGWVTVGMSADTAEFAVASIERWWEKMGSVAYPNARKLLITADAGGSNGHRNRLWKKKIAEFAAKTGLEITVCHFPPGTSKWNKIEHRMFSQITLNWRGRPLQTHETVVNPIGSTTTKTGLKINAELNPQVYLTGLKVTDQEIKKLPLQRHKFHGDWNYTMNPSRE